MTSIPFRRDEPIIFKPWFKLTLIAVLGIAMIWVLLWIPGMLSSFLIAIILVFILDPAVNFFERHGLTRSKSILLVFTLIFVVSVLVFLMMSRFMVQEYEDFSSRADSYSTLIKDEFNRRAMQVERKLGLDRYGATLKATSWAQEEFRHVALSNQNAFATVISWFLIVPLLLYFFLQDGEHFKKAFIAFLPNRYFEMSLIISHKISEIVGNFIRAKLLECVAVGFCAWIGFVITGLIFKPLNYALILAILVGLFNIIPYLGPIVSAIPVLFIAVVQYVLIPQLETPVMAAESAVSWAPVLAIGCALVFAHLVDNVYLIPVVLGHSVNVHPLVVLLSVIVGAEVLGAVGMIISIPVASIIQTSARELALGIRSLRH